MEPGLAKVVTLDSDSDNELEIISESIPNYGNYSTPVEVAPELQEKIRISLEKRASLPGKIKTIKVYVTVRSSQTMGLVTASFRSSCGQPNKTINVGASINDLFTNQVRGGGNNNIRKPQIPTASNSSKPVQVVQKGSPQLLPVGPKQRVTQRPSTSSSPVILYSPIRKGKTAQKKILYSPIGKGKTAQQKHSVGRSLAVLDRALPTLGFQQTVTHPPENQSPSTPSLVSWTKNISKSETKTSKKVVANIPKDKDDQSQEFSKTEMKTSEEFQVKANIPKDKYGLPLYINLITNDPVFKNVCAKVNPVELSPIRFSSDEDEEQSVEDSMFGIWNSPVPSTHNYVDPLLDLEQNSSFGKENKKDCEDVNGDSRDEVVDEKTLQNMPMHLVKEMWDKMNEDEKISKQHNVYEKEPKIHEEEESDQDEQDYNGARKNVLYNETEIILTDVYNEEKCSYIGSENQNSNDKFVMSKYVKINVETLPKRMVGSSASRNENESFHNDSSDKDLSDPSPWSIKDGSDPPLWRTIFPPSPPSPPPEGWTLSSSLWELDESGFEAVTGLCGHQTANDFKRKLNDPKPLVRVLRKRPKN